MGDYSYGQVKTSESIGKVFDAILAICEEKNAPVVKLDKSSHRIIAKSPVT